MSAPRRKAFKYESVYLLVKAMIFIARLMPRSWWLSLCGGLARLYFRFARNERRKAIASLTIAYGQQKTSAEIIRLAWKSFTMLGKNAGDILRSSRSTAAQLDAIIKTTGVEYFDQALTAGKGLIFITGHIGAFELMVSYFSVHFRKPYVIGTPLKDPKLNDLLLAQRGSHGAMPVERGKDMAKIFRYLKDGGPVAILIDQDTRVKSTFVDFFGTPAYTPIGAALLAQRTGATVLVGAIHLDDNNQHHLEVKPPIPVTTTGNEENDLTANTQRFTKELEDFIRKNPEQWIWMHQRWKTRPGVEEATATF